MEAKEACPILARDAVERLQEQGLNPSLDHIAELIELARRVQEPAARIWPYLTHTGIYAAGHRFRPLSIKAELWFDWFLDNFDSEILQTYAFAYASEFGHLPETDFAEITDIRSAKTVIGAYAGAMSCNAEQLQEALRRVMDEPTEGDRIRARNSTEPDNLEDTVAQLVAATGLSEEHWKTKTLRFALQVLHHSLAYATGIFADQSDAASSPEYQRANFDFIARLEQIERELRGETVSNG